MSLLDKASLIVTPNAYKESKLYSVVPNTTLGDMDVVRATTATRVNSAGFIEDVPYNLLQRSEQFDNAIYTKTSSSVTANATTAPNGTATADKLVEDSTTNQHRADQTSISTIGTNTFSVYAKKAERDSLWLRVGTSGAYFDLTNGTISGATGVTASIESLPNGWYRCIITRISTVSNEIVRINLAIGTNGTYLGNGTSGFFIWGAQLVTGSVAKDYFPTTDKLNIPRIDYTNGSCPSLLVEPQRTNSIQYSNAISAYFFNGVSVINAVTSPQGINNAFSFDVTNGTQGGLSPVTITTSAQSYTFSVYLKGSVNGQKVRLFGDLNGAIQDFTLTTEWARYTKTFTGAVGAQSIYLLNGSYFSPAQNDLYYGYGMQIETGAYATSLIPTTGSVVTRNADLISKTGISSLIGQTEGTIFVEANLSVNASERRVITVSNGTESQRIMFWTDGTILYANFNNLSVTIGTFPIGIAKIALGYTISGGSTTYSIKLNNNTLITGTSATAPNPLNSINIGTTTGLGLILNDRINSVQIYKTRLTNAEIASLTTL